MSAKELIDIYISFFVKRKHKQIANSPLVPDNDPTTLFTSSGMQPLVPYLLGQSHPSGTRLVNVQNSFRAQDIDEVGDNRHTTFFRMLGNWSLGDYFKKEEIPWFWEFLTQELKLPKDKLYITIFSGDGKIDFDAESHDIWETLLKKEGLQDRIFQGDVTKNWWSRSGIPENMPPGEPGGPDTEVYYMFDGEHGPECKIGNPNDPTWCECGKFLEIGNAVFMQYIKQDDSSFRELPNKNVDFGGGLERLLAAIENQRDIFQTSLFKTLIKDIETELGIKYEKDSKNIRIIADHIKASAFLIRDGVLPGNKVQGYVLRSLLRRVATKTFLINKVKSDSKFFGKIVQSVINSEKESFTDDQIKTIKTEVSLEIRKFRTTLEKGLKELEKSLTNRSNLGLIVFNLFQSYGYPLELSIELLNEKGIKFTSSDLAQYDEAKKTHAELSKSASSGMFKGGLADTSELTIMGHTATHLMHQALRDVLGNSVHQTGSNITSSRVRFDFNFDRNLTEEEIKKVEEIVNEKIKENLPVHFEMMPLQKAKDLGAIGLFDDKYQESVKVYFVGDYSKEFCGGPHVEFTGVIKKFKIIKQENIGKGQRRLYVKIENQI